MNESKRNILIFSDDDDPNLSLADLHKVETVRKREDLGDRFRSERTKRDEWFWRRGQCAADRFDERTS